MPQRKGSPGQGPAGAREGEADTPAAQIGGRQRARPSAEVARTAPPRAAAIWKLGWAFGGTSATVASVGLP
eukprot:15371331-Alexandrium_andersonii.AAC.1